MSDIKKEEELEDGCNKIERIEQSLDSLNNFTRQLKVFSERLITNNISDPEEESLKKVRSLAKILDELPNDITMNTKKCTSILNDLNDILFS